MMFYYFNAVDEKIAEWPKSNPRSFMGEENYYKEIIGYEEDGSPTFDAPIANENVTDNDKLETELEKIRIIRNQLLTETDWTQLEDFPGTADNKTAFQTYRDALRDITDGVSDIAGIKAIEWPEEPAYVKDEG